MGSDEYVCTPESRDRTRSSKATSATSKECSFIALDNTDPPHLFKKCQDPKTILNVIVICDKTDKIACR
jgi:hypothetical protein